MTLSRRARLVLSITFGVLAGFAAIVAIMILRFQPIARSYVVSTIERRYRGRVELGDFQISLFPTVRATGENLVVRWNEDKALPPMISIRRFTVESPFVSFFRSPRRIHKLTLEGLQLNIPPASERPAMESSNSGTPPFILEEIVADGTTLVTLPADPSKQPLRFLIRQLDLRTVGPNLPMTFQAILDNAKPPGLIQSNGRFGPWKPDDPRSTSLSGGYTFSNADLSVFHGILGTLTSTGNYTGELDRIEVQGTADVPNFALTSGDRGMHLLTRFQATVDGTDGDTVLHPVRATLGNSNFEVSGAIERSALETHKDIHLQARAQNTGLQDFLRLAIRSSKPPMLGKISFQTQIEIPPGKTPVVDRMQLDGAFTLNGVTFTSPEVQAKIASLSHRAEGDPKATDTNDVTANFAGYFHLKNGTMMLPQLRFEVPGAHISLDGHYGIESQDIDFTGTAKLDATVSHMTTGWKRLLLTPIDPLFKRDGAGTVLPIRISGTRGNPSFKLDIGRVLKRK